jgi:hypothetical protein
MRLYESGDRIVGKPLRFTEGPSLDQRDRDMRNDIPPGHIRWECSECDFQICSGCAVACAAQVGAAPAVTQVQLMTERGDLRGDSRKLNDPVNYVTSPGKRRCEMGWACMRTDAWHFEMWDHPLDHPRIMLQSAESKGFDVSFALSRYAKLNSSQVFHPLCASALTLEPPMDVDEALDSMTRMVEPHQYPVSMQRFASSYGADQALLQLGSQNEELVRWKRACARVGSDECVSPPKFMRVADRSRRSSAHARTESRAMAEVHMVADRPSASLAKKGQPSLQQIDQQSSIDWPALRLLSTKAHPPLKRSFNDI